VEARPLQDSRSGDAERALHRTVHP
jgi:hypothetical protein